MQKMRLDKKGKSTTPRKKRTFQYLELLIKENSGNSSTYCVPVTIAAKEKTSKIHILQQLPRISNTRKITVKTIRVVNPEELINKEIYLRRGRKIVKGIVLEVKPLRKGPEGNPVPTPPSDLD